MHHRSQQSGAWSRPWAWLAHLSPVAFLLLGAGPSSCSGEPSPHPADDASLAGRVFRPPSGKVRALPPHNIYAEGVGPYHLGASLQEVFGLLPHGPRVELMQIEGLVDYRVVRAEGDALFIGVERRGGVGFVAVLDPEIARTESGVGVGTSLSDLVKALGGIGNFDGGRDARVVEFAKLPMARFIVEGERVVAVVVVAVGREEAKTAAPVRQGPVCDGLASRREEVGAASRLGGPGGAVQAAMATGCFLAGQQGAVVWADERFTLVTEDAGKLKRLGQMTVSGLLFAGALDTDGDSRHEVVAVAERSDARSRSVWIEVYALEGGRLVMATSQRVYSLSAEAATWVGANLRDSSFLIEARAEPGAVEVGGFLFQRVRGRPRNIVPLREVSVQVRSRRRPSPASRSQDAGPARPADGGGREP